MSVNFDKNTPNCASSTSSRRRCCSLQDWKATCLDQLPLAGWSRWIGRRRLLGTGRGSRGAAAGQGRGRGGCGGHPWEGRARWPWCGSRPWEGWVRRPWRGGGPWEARGGRGGRPGEGRGGRGGRPGEGAGRAAVARRPTMGGSGMTAGHGWGRGAAALVAQVRQTRPRACERAHLLVGQRKTCPAPLLVMSQGYKGHFIPGLCAGERQRSAFG